MPSAEHITETVNRYISLVAKGTADDIVELYADDATVEDPVGARDPHRPAGDPWLLLRLRNMERDNELSR